MIHLHYWPTPNGHKITIFLEEAGLKYDVIPVNIGRGDQLKSAFLAISPNNRIPAIIDDSPDDGGEPLSVFESGAILQYLAQKSGLFLSSEPRARIMALEWLYWQVGGLGPMLGQNQHFAKYAPEKIPYAIERYVNETRRLYKVLNTHLDGRTFITGQDYSIADMAAYPWIVHHEEHGIKLADFPHIKSWFETIRERPAIQRAYKVAEKVQVMDPTQDSLAHKILFGLTQ
ncbi:MULTISPECIES: glutathione binding-like protein [Acinetobacter]|jgi:GSH-dependent disulfide-bond oxidoreductase|uniref:glutathione binding-like protein n=1 Tax=Acinetobacter TaxID=469 RepID=UPI001EEFF588|nr:MULTISPECIES: glutathione binding-like protein [Acinetobacter]MCG7220036.1 glutathione binding-like protein [Acinetobacter sp. AG3]MDO6642709.1 glutathione binding-like protein [Acinetobacter guillouiae]